MQIEPWLRAIIGDADMPARRIKPSRYSITGYVSTTKAPVAQEAESTLEQDFMTLLEHDRTVEKFLAQPFTIRWRDQRGRQCRYTPDVIVKYASGASRDGVPLRTSIFEVKPLEVLRENWGELRPKFKAAIGWAREFGGIFHLVTEREIRTPYLKNVTFLGRYRNRFLPEVEELIAFRQDLVLRTLADLGETTPRGLLEAMNPDPWQQAELLPWVWNLTLQQLIGVDLSEPLTMESRIWCVYQPSGGSNIHA